MNKVSLTIIEAYKRGYRVNEEGVLININGECIPTIFKHVAGGGRRKINNPPYYAFRLPGVKNGGEYATKTPIHRLCAYCKYGDEIFGEGIHVRHLNNNSLDNSWDNIAIGSPRDNALDNDPSGRMERAIHAASHNRSFNNEEIELIRIDRKSGMTYKDIMNKWGISSKGSLHHYLNNSYVSEKRE